MIICMRRGKRLREWRVVRIMGCREGLCPFRECGMIRQNPLLGGHRQKQLLSEL